MQAEIVNIALAFFEGLALIISPCILPILPIILSGSLSGSRLRPLGIITGFILTFTVVTLSSRALIQHLSINQNVLRNISFAILLLFGIIMMSSSLTNRFNLLTERLSRFGSSYQFINQPQDGFLSGILFGSLVGVIWTPCAGPILASVIVQVVIAHTTYSSLLIVLAFAIGAGLPMFLIALLGNRIISKLSYFRKHPLYFRQLLGLILILTVSFLFFVPDFGLSILDNKENNQLQFKPKSATSLITGLNHPYPSPNIAGISAWINSKPLSLSELKGKVILIDFWTYSCINCIRTFPYLKNWYAKYHDKGFEIIGVHSPEFQFEHDVNNVKKAAVQYGLNYPIALDNQFVTWRNFNNSFWPAHFLINQQGEVVYVHFGEGEYDVTENNIRYLLGLSKEITKKSETENNVFQQTPETYLGFNRSERFGSRETILPNLPNQYSFPDILPLHHWGLEGTWRIVPENIISITPNASIRLHFKARKVFMVMGSIHPMTVNVFLNGKFILPTDSGTDVKNASVIVREERLYEIVDLKNGDEGILQLTAISPGLYIYTFTFGN